MDILPDDAPAPRLCHLIKWADFDGYGFNLHAERSNPGQFIGKIDDDSPAQMAGLREGDRIVEVNGVNINNENHRQVVERIKSDPQETRLLVVDVETDLWYNEQDLVVKSDQVNVVYMKTPVPRPKADSPRANFHRQPEPTYTMTSSGSLSPSTLGGGASSLETSDFNDDSIEQQQQQQQQKKDILNQNHQQSSAESANHQEPPMSPDSGRGDEDSPISCQNAATVVVEAEINRQSPIKSPDLSPNSEQNSKERDENNSFKDINTHNDIKQDTLEQYQANELQPDSLGQDESSMSPLPTTTIQNEDECKRMTSADSGQSSTSPDLNSRAESLADSLDDQDQSEVEKVSIVENSTNKPTGDQPNVPEQNYEKETVDEVNETIKSLQDSALSKIAKTMVKDEAQVDLDLKNVLKDDLPLSGNHKELAPLEATTEMTKSLDVEQLKEDTSSRTSPPIDGYSSAESNVLNQSIPHNDTSNTSLGNINNNNNNSYSGLNLNMTASEMRELLSRRKKFDPKKAQMNIRQKYEIIQQM